MLGLAQVDFFGEFQAKQFWCFRESFKNSVNFFFEKMRMRKSLKGGQVLGEQAEEPGPTITTHPFGALEWSPRLSENTNKIPQ